MILVLGYQCSFVLKIIVAQTTRIPQKTQHLTDIQQKVTDNLHKDAKLQKVLAKSGCSECCIHAY